MKKRFLERLFTRGTLTVHYAGGQTLCVGSGQPEAHVHLRNRKVVARLFANPEIAFGDAYMDGDWWPGEGGLQAVFALYFANAGNFAQGRAMAVARRAVRGIVELNGKWRSERNVHHHYDIDNDLFQHFLDEDMQYSCAYWETPDATLEQAQQAKLRHIARKLCLSSGQKVLDIGCGWGGMALYLAREYDVEVTGLTLSDDQLAHAKKRAEAHGLTRRVHFLKEDYRDHQGEYDAIVSVGMFEHVGRPQFQTYFDQVARLLKPDGRSLIHTIGRNAPPPLDTRGWIRKHIFPGGYVPSLSEMTPCIEKTGMDVADMEIWRLHYARTLAAWNQRFQACRSIFADKLGERFCRMWEFYLLGCEASFRYGDSVVFQVQLSHANDAVPITRDYLYGDHDLGASNRDALDQTG
ncbi:MAG: cyclopropane-fatty-acyl-phospholipid synthase [Salinisphaera sp.]|nr:cyclopropane-fatty-acyl-phospholipid synthase [Salinisphaera sp.]